VAISTPYFTGLNGGACEESVVTCGKGVWIDTPSRPMPFSRGNYECKKVHRTFVFGCTISEMHP